MSQGRRHISAGCALSWGRMKPESIAWAPASSKLPEGPPEFSGEAGSDSTVADCSAHQHRSTLENDLLLGCFPAVARESWKPFPAHRWVYRIFISLTILRVVQHRLTWVTFLQMSFSIHGKINLTFVKSRLKIQCKTHTTFPVASFYAFGEVRNQKNISLSRSFKKIFVF